jgi:hypothetical protein
MRWWRDVAPRERQRSKIRFESASIGFEIGFPGGFGHWFHWMNRLCFASTFFLATQEHVDARVRHAHDNSEGLWFRGRVSALLNIR